MYIPWCVEKSPECTSWCAGSSTQVMGVSWWYGMVLQSLTPKRCRAIRMLYQMRRQARSTVRVLALERTAEATTFSPASIVCNGCKKEQGSMWLLRSAEGIHCAERFVHILKIAIRLKRRMEFAGWTPQALPRQVDRKR